MIPHDYLCHDITSPMIISLLSKLRRITNSGDDLNSLSNVQMTNVFLRPSIFSVRRNCFIEATLQKLVSEGTRVGIAWSERPGPSAPDYS